MAGFAVSLGVNVILAGYLYLFVPNSPFRPVCNLPSGTTKELKGELTLAFQNFVSPTLSYYGMRVGPEWGRLHVARWERWFDTEMLLNATSHAARAVYDERGMKVDWPTCEDVRRVAILGAG